MIAILIVCWNHFETTTARCVRSLRSFTDLPYRAICVDNGSEDETADYLSSLSQRDERFSVIANTTNVGWAEGTLQAMEQLRDEDHWICLLNSDTIVTPGWLSKLKSHLEGNPDLNAILPNEHPVHGGVASGASNHRETPIVAESLPAQPLPSTREVLELAAQVESDFRGMLRLAKPSGFCLLARRQSQAVLSEYLRDFESFHQRERSWDEFWSQVQGRAAIALDTYVFHSRAGSGGYYNDHRER